MIIKIMNFFYKRIILIGFFYLTFFNFSYSSESKESFENWLSSFKTFASSKGISDETIKIAFKNVKFLDQVIKYDRKQPEFFEDTITYVSKRANNFRKNKAKKLLKENKSLFVKVENEFNVEKEILLSLWGIETNFCFS